jgi:hypothetical protein
MEDETKGDFMVKLATGTARCRIERRSTYPPTERALRFLHARSAVTRRFQVTLGQRRLRARCGLR